MSAIRQALRTATATAHDRVDGSLRLMDPDLDAPTVVRALQILEAFTRGAESTVDPAGVTWGDPMPRNQWLRADLGTMKAAPDPRPVAIPIDGPQEALGVHYVLEGSSLGARQIAAHLDSIGGFQASYFHRVAAAGSAGRWPRFLAHLSSQPDAHHAAIVHGAVQAFEALAARVD